MEEEINLGSAFSKAREVMAEAKLEPGKPLDVDALIAAQTDIALCSFDRADAKGVDISCFGSNSSVLMEYEGRHIIFYNQDEPKERRDFSKLHEFGHYILSHNFNATGSIYDRQELEANYFADKVLSLHETYTQIYNAINKIILNFTNTIGENFYSEAVNAIYKFAPVPMEAR